MNLRTLIASATLALVSGTVLAQAAAPAASATMPRVDARRANQEKRIEAGVAGGALTPRETRKLEREQKHIAKAEAQAKSDGTVTPAERQKLHRMQNAASKDIAHQKHDAQTTTAVPVAAPAYAFARLNFALIPSSPAHHA